MSLPSLQPREFGAAASRLPKRTAPSVTPALFFWLVVLSAFHVPLALLLFGPYPIASTVHAVATFLLGLWWAGWGRKPHRVAYIGAYLVGAEVLWRMTDAKIFWEFGKYAMTALFLVAIVRRRVRSPGPMHLYFALLVPSTVLTLAALSLSGARNEISFNLSGPLALAVAAWFFSQLTLSPTQVLRLLAAMMAPIVAVCTLAISGTATESPFVVEGGSIVATSGGFGPNQVSATLGLGSLMAFLCAQNVQFGKTLRIVLLAACVVFAAQSALTFSRTGLYAAAGSALAAVFYLVREGRGGARAIGIVALCFLLANFVVLPRLDSFTGGRLSSRFASVDLTRRDEIALSDLEIGLEHPILGVGPGLSRTYRKTDIGRHVVHTEFSRLFAEHGILGLAALVLLVVSARRNIRRQRSAMAKAIVAAMVVWSFLFMATTAMRLVAPSFLYGVGFSTILSANPRVLRSGSRKGGREATATRPLGGP